VPSPRHALAALLCTGAALAAPATARAHHWPPGSCGLPTTLPLHVEYAEIAASPTVREEVFAPAGSALVLATSGPWLPGQLRSFGARTVFWQMKLERLVGLPAVPADATGVDAAADRLVDRAVRETGCATPLIALNELQGAWTPTPWSAAAAQYRANVLAALRRMHDRGARSFLLVTTTPKPNTESPEAAAWWRAVADVADVVLQVHFSGPYIARRGAIVGSRLRRQRMRAVLAQFEAAGVPPGRLGLLHGFQSGRGAGGREGLPLPSWLRVVKWEALALKQVAAERAAAGKPLASAWSWGWGEFPVLSQPDPDKHVTACVWLWVRDSRLCDGPARARGWATSFATSLVEGQLALAPGVACFVGWPRRSIAVADVDRLAAVLGPDGVGPVPRMTALTALLARTVDWAAAPVRAGDVLAAEEQIVQTVFLGSREAYAAALAERNADVELARGVIVDQLIARRAANTRALAKALNTTTCADDAVPPPFRADLTPWLPFLRLP
jgi:hypothetical protein